MERGRDGECNKVSHVISNELEPVGGEDRRRRLIGVGEEGVSRGGLSRSGRRCLSDDSVRIGVSEKILVEKSSRVKMAVAVELCSAVLLRRITECLCLSCANGRGEEEMGAHLHRPRVRAQIGG